MSEEVTVKMLLHPDHAMLTAVRNHELTRCEDADEMNKRIGWLLCAYDVMIDSRLSTPFNETGA